MGEIKHLASFEADRRGMREGLSGRNDDWLKLSDAGWDAFKRLGFPTARRGNEQWKYTDIRTINETEFRRGLPSFPPSDDMLEQNLPLVTTWDAFVFVDGNLYKTLGKREPDSRPTRADDTSESDAGSEDFELRIGSLAEVESDPFIALNSALHTNQFQVVVPRRPSPPVHLVSVSTGGGSDARANYPRFSLRGPSGTSTTLIETHISLTDDSVLELPVVEILLDEDASLTHYRVQMSGARTYHIGTTRVHQKAGSSYNSVAFATGAAISRHDIHTNMDEGADCKLHGLYITNGNEHQSHEVSVTHSQPHGTSDQFYKGILSGKSQAVFSGKVVVERGAQKTDAQQKDLNLLLSHGAEIDTKPSLEIYADDIQAGHGATAGHVDEDTLFYLQSRGVDYDTAQAMLIRGFAQEILDEFELPELHEFLTRKVDELLPELQATSDTIGTA